MCLHSVNYEDADLPSPLPSSFKLTAFPDTDIWRKPPNVDRFNAPILYRSLPLTELRRARVTVSTSWNTLYDQGGLCLVLPNISQNRERQWLKTGIEFTHGAPHISTVACDRFADWSLLPLKGNKVTVEMEREVKEGNRTSTLWIYALENGQRRPMREVTWVFESLENPQSDPPECWIGVYVACPSKNRATGEKLSANFDDLQIETWDD